MRAAADELELVASFDAERDGAPLDMDHFGGRSNVQADRRRRDMADVELDPEALMAGRQKMLDRRQGRGLNHIDHHRRRQDRDSSRADEGRRMLGADHDFGGSDEAGRDFGQDGADAGWRIHAAL